MCGIIGVTGAESPFGLICEGLAALEYRGYDSAGVACVVSGAPNLWRVRAAEQRRSVEVLSEQIAPEQVTAALGHTRWATHGAPREENAHPMFDCHEAIAVVHNGIIENHRELAEELDANGHVFTSDTDTEVIAHLLEEHCARGLALSEALRAVVALLRGDFAIAAIAAGEPDVLVAARRTAPLILGVAPGACYISSDIAALLGTTRELYQLADDEIAEVRPSGIRIVTLSGDPVVPQALVVTWDVERARKDGYADFMTKEIFEQPHAIQDTLMGRFDSGVTDIEELALEASDLAGIERVVLVACGSSYHAALVGAHAIEQLARIPAQAEIASEFRYRDAVIDANTLVIAVSQSGETVDTLHAMRQARRLGARVVAVTNVVDSLMAREADGVCYTHAGPEIGVASTKCHIAQLVMLECFALHLAQAKKSQTPDRLEVLANDLVASGTLIEETLVRAEELKAVARRFADVRDFYFLGRGLGYPLALEGALKLKELAYVRAEAYAAGEMKHGPISLIEPGAVVVVMATRSHLWEKVMSNVAEVRARGATILALGEQGDEETAAIADAFLSVPKASELCAPIVGVVPLQLFAYEIAREKGNDVDRPRNLAKVVTVE